jgi:cytoskeletal protein RodZ
MPDDELFNLIETEEQDEDAAPVTADATLGERLRARRRQQGLSLYQAAQELRADPAMLRAMEADDFAMLGAPVYIKGHLRKYAALLGLSPDEVFADYLRNHDLEESVPLVNRVVDPGRPARDRWWIGPILLLLALVAAVAWWMTREPAQPDSPAATPAATTPQPVALTGFPPMPAVADAAGPPDDPAPELEPAVAGEALRIDLIFVGDSWVEVTDADGQRLVFGLMRAGRTDSVLGMPPVEVLLGSADAVRLEVNGRPLDIAPGDVRGGVARLTISGP